MSGNRRGSGFDASRGRGSGGGREGFNPPTEPRADREHAGGERGRGRARGGRATLLPLGRQLPPSSARIGRTQQGQRAAVSTGGARGGTGASRTANDGDSREDVPRGLGRTASPEGERVGRQRMTLPDVETSPAAFYPPEGGYVDQTDLPEGTKDKVGGWVCPHCLLPFDREHKDSRLCTEKCGKCGTKDHQGRYCSKLYVSKKFYSEKMNRLPYADENVRIRPSESQLKRLREKYADFPDLRKAQGVRGPKRTADEADLDKEAERRAKKQKSGVDKERVQKEFWEAEAKRLQAENNALRADRDMALSRAEAMDGQLRERDIQLAAANAENALLRSLHRLPPAANTQAEEADHAMADAGDQPAVIQVSGSAVSESVERTAAGGEEDGAEGKKKSSDDDIDLIIFDD